MDAEALAFRGDSFDTVVDSMALCTFPDPVEGLREMARVCRPGGRILLVEHGRSDRGPVGRFQDRHVGWLADRVGCHWNREPGELAEEAGLEVVRARRTFLGIFHGIVARPG
jgi:ubiquinone/menaquinone biosynthesis C-methylase UbiE